MHRRIINIECRSRFAFRALPSDLIHYRQLAPFNADTGLPSPLRTPPLSHFPLFGVSATGGNLFLSTVKAQSDKQAADRVSSGVGIDLASIGGLSETTMCACRRG